MGKVYSNISKKPAELWSTLWWVTLWIALLRTEPQLHSSGQDVRDDTCLSGPKLEDRLQYMASVRKPGSRSHICSSVLISSEFAVSAAHCVDERSSFSAGRKPILHIGPATVDDVDENVEVVRIEDSYIHPLWDHSQRSAYNIALLRLASSTNRSHPVLPFEGFNMRTGQQLTVAGWGSGGDSIPIGGTIFHSLKIESVELIEQEHCNRAALWNGSIPEGMVCALKNERTASCLVDSGSPLLLLDMPHHDFRNGKPELDFLLGMNVDGAPCGTPQKPDLFISLEHVREWIMKHISK